ncbi:MAG: hypothetical protein ACKVQW_10780 [Pyrinomonadaceae bacterium]
MNYYNYFTEIEETFVRRRGKHLFLSPLDWALIDGWKERGIPLHIVIRSIESVFDVYERQPVGTRSIKTLFYCREEIESQYNEWLKSQVGKSNEDAADGTAAFSADDIVAHITGSIEKLRAVAYPELNEGISRVIERLEGLRDELTGDVETVDKTLGDIEKTLDRALLEGWDRENIQTLEREIAGQLRAYKAEMERDAYKNTYDLMLLKRLREEAGIPRLSLFYL